MPQSFAQPIQNEGILKKSKKCSEKFCLEGKKGRIFAAAKNGNVGGCSS